MAIFLGIDGGGSKTDCLVGDGLRVLGKARAEGSNPARVGEDVARRSLQRAIREACMAAGVAPGEVKAACAGVAGMSIPGVREFVERSVKEVLGGALWVVGDMEIALEDAFADTPGVIVIAGTGSIAYGCAAPGRTARAGGWGPAVSDEGSGYWIGREAVAGVFRAHDEGRTTSLAAPILKAWHAADWRHLAELASTTPVTAYASLVPIVLSGAEAGDWLARDVLARAGGELAKLGCSVINRLETESQAVRVALAGGVFHHAFLVRLAFFRALRMRCPRAAVSFRIVNPAQGALSLARKLASTGQRASKGALHASSIRDSGLR